MTEITAGSSALDPASRGSSDLTIFRTLEDETGTVNVVVWPRLWENVNGQNY